MPKIDLQNIASLNNKQSTLNILNNNSAEVEAKSDTFLSRVGTSPNQMEADIDMNSQRIINLPEPATGDEPVRLQDLATIIGEGTITNGAPPNASYITVGSNVDLTNERVLTAGNGINIVDGGANGAVTLSTDPLFFNVRDYGAVGDNTTDDTTAIQDTVDAALQSGAQYGKIFFPPGQYKITSSIIVPNFSGEKGIIFEGSGSSSSITGTFSDYLVKNQFAVTNFGITGFRDLKFFNGSTNIASGCIRWPNGFASFFENLFCIGFNGIYTHGFNQMVKNCQIIGIDVSHLANSVGLRMSADGGNVQSCTIRGFSHGIRCRGNIHISGFDIENNMVGIATGYDHDANDADDYGFNGSTDGALTTISNGVFEANGTGILNKGQLTVINCGIGTDAFCSPLTALEGGLIVTGNVTNGSPTITNITPNTTGMSKGQFLKNIDANGDTYFINSVDSASQVTISGNWNSGTATGRTLFCERLSLYGIRNEGNRCTVIDCTVSGPYAPSIAGGVGGKAISITFDFGHVTFVDLIAKNAVADAETWGTSSQQRPVLINCTRFGGDGVLYPVQDRTFAQLPGVNDRSVGDKYDIVDSNTVVFRATAAGGGSSKVEVRWDGTNWLVSG